VSGDVAPYAFEARLTVCIDFRNPHAYLSVAPTRALESRLGAAFDWLPFAAPLLYRAPAARPDDDRGTRHRRIRALYFERDLERYAAARGIVLHELHRDVDVAAAAAGMLWLRAQGNAGLSDYVERVFERLWRDGHDVADRGIIAAMLGCSTSAFDAFFETEGRRELDALQARLSAAGIFNVPAYVLRGGEPFYGRQHLPLVEAILRTGSTNLPDARSTHDEQQAAR
jgi:2-hydroxychromene-2-carboxylate isomerase